MANRERAQEEAYQIRLDHAKGFAEVYEIVKDTVKHSLREYRVGMMLYLDDLPIHLGAYHPVGTNNIVLNRSLLHLIEASTQSLQTVNAFVYTILLHEYLHALGYLRETEVNRLIQKITEESFGATHIATELGRNGPWSILKGVPINMFETPKRVREVVKNFDKPDTRYIA
ncbi:MAG: hypothetical protein ACXACF_00425 [Candidatus Hermodarchaeia archaeon]|jgi:hypothetical protein